MGGQRELVSLFWVVGVAALERRTDHCAAVVVLRALDEQSAGVGEAGLGDRPEPALLAGGVLAWDDPQG